MKIKQMNQDQSDKSAAKLKDEKRQQQLSSAIQWLLTQAGTRKEATNDIGAMAGRMPEAAPDILKLLDLFPQTDTPIDLDSLKKYSQLLGFDSSGDTTAGSSGSIDPDYFTPLK